MQNRQLYRLQTSPTAFHHSTAFPIATMDAGKAEVYVRYDLTSPTAERKISEVGGMHTSERTFIANVTSGCFTEWKLLYHRTHQSSSGVLSKIHTNEVIEETSPKPSKSHSNFGEPYGSESTASPNTQTASHAASQYTTGRDRLLRR